MESATFSFRHFTKFSSLDLEDK